MKNDLTCGVVRDLLPSYVENLLGEESREAVDRHLETCPDCAARKEAMSAPAAEEETGKEVDFLKKVKKRSTKRMVLAAALTAAVLLGGFALKLFVIGTPLQPQSVAVAAAEVQDGENLLFLSLTAVGSGDAFYGWKMETVDGVTSIYARRVTVSPFCRIGDAQMYVPLEGVREVWLGGISGRLLWQDGMVISQECLDLLALRTPYCGDAPALGRIAQALKLQERLGSYTMELQTSRQPYRWTLYFENELSDSQRTYMTRCEYLMLALVDNLDSVRIYPPAEEGEEPMWSQEMLLDSADRAVSRGGTTMNGDKRSSLTDVYNKAHKTDWKAKTSVKDYIRTPADFQRLIAVLDYYFLEGGQNAE